jgi:prophage maintenance system killer protein
MVHLPTEKHFRMVFRIVQELQRQHKDEGLIADSEYKFEKNYKPLISILEFGIPSRNYDFFDNISYVFRDLNNGHHLSDGNKRYAFQFTLTFLKLNDYLMLAKKSERYNFCIRLSMEELDIPTIKMWLITHTKEIGTDSID